MSFYPVYFLALPLLNIISRIYRVPGTDAELTKRGTVVLWTALAVLLIFVRIANMAYAPNMIFLKHVAPSKSSLGRTFGIAQMVASIARGIAPTLTRCDSFIPDYLVLKNDTPRLQLTLRTLDRLRLTWRVACVDSHDRRLRHGCIHGKERKGRRGREGTTESTACLAGMITRCTFSLVPFSSHCDRHDFDELAAVPVTLSLLQFLVPLPTRSSMIAVNYDGIQAQKIG